MITMRAFQSAAPLALVAMLALFTAAAAQDTPPAKQKAPAKETKEPKEKKKPAEKKAVDKEKKPAKAAPGGGQPTLLGQFGDWGAYTAASGARKVCYALAKPASSQTEPPNKPRDPAYIFVSTRPSENVRNEVSIVIGYPFKPNTEASAVVGTASFALYTQQDGAWIKNVSEEARLVDALRSGQSAVVKGVSVKGTQSTDTFSLKGFSQALDRTDQECK